MILQRCAEVNVGARGKLTLENFVVGNVIITNRESSLTIYCAESDIFRNLPGDPMASYDSDV